MLVLAMEFSRSARALDLRNGGCRAAGGVRAARRPEPTRIAGSGQPNGRLSLPQNGIVMPDGARRARRPADGTPGGVRSVGGGMPTTPNSQ
jgi:hypothetical protein